MSDLEELAEHAAALVTGESGGLGMVNQYDNTMLKNNGKVLHSHWYWHDELGGFVVHACSEHGHVIAGPPDVEVFVMPDSSMPTAVQQWFINRDCKRGIQRCDQCWNFDCSDNHREG